MIVRTTLLILLTCVCINLQAQVNIISTIAGNGTQGYAGDGGPATAAEFNHADVIWLYKDSLYIADALNHRVRKIDLSTGIITTVAGTGTPGYNGDNIPATDAQLQVPSGVCLDTFGNLYISDVFNRRIRKVTAVTGIITTVAGNGTSGNSGDGGLAINAEIAGPFGLLINRDGSLYFADAWNNNIRKINPMGIISTISGTGSAGYTGDGGPASNAQLNSPSQLSLDGNNNIIFSDNQNYAIRKIDAITGIITTIAGNGTIGYTGDGGPASNAQLNQTSGVFVDKYNNIFFSELNDIVRKIDGATGIITTVAGCGIFGFLGDGGPATAAELNFPNGIFLDSFGTMYIADYKFNNRIRKVYNPQLGVNTIHQSNEVLVYPNPANNELTIEYIFANNEDAIFQITDLMGRIVTTKKLPGKKQKAVVNMNSLIPGLYLYKVIQENIVISAGKIIKE